MVAATMAMDPRRMVMFCSLLVWLSDHPSAVVVLLMAAMYVRLLVECRPWTIPEVIGYLMFYAAASAALIGAGYLLVAALHWLCPNPYSCCAERVPAVDRREIMRDNGREMPWPDP